MTKNPSIASFTIDAAFTATAAVPRNVRSRKEE